MIHLPQERNATMLEISSILHMRDEAVASLTASIRHSAPGILLVFQRGFMNDRGTHLVTIAPDFGARLPRARPFCRIRVAAEFTEVGVCLLAAAIAQALGDLRAGGAETPFTIRVHEAPEISRGDELVSVWCNLLGDILHESGMVSGMVARTPE
jgi:hypothetical protein